MITKIKYAPKILHFRIRLTNQDELERAQKFARMMKLSGLSLSDWLFRQIESYEKSQKENLTAEYLTAQGVIDYARINYALELNMADLQYWRDKKKLPKLRMNFDYIPAPNSPNRKYLYRRDKLAKFFKAFRAMREPKEKKRKEKEIFADNQEFTLDQNAFEKTEKKNMKSSGGFKVLSVNED